MRQRYTLTLGTGQLFRIIFFRRPAKKKVRPDGHREYFVEKLDFDSFSNKDVIQFFNNFFDFLEKLTLEEVKTLIKEFINDLKNLAIYMDKFKCENLVEYMESVNRIEKIPDIFFNQLEEKLKAYFIIDGMCLKLFRFG